MERIPGVGTWILREDLMDYIIESYAGVDTSTHGNRRIFIWSDDGNRIFESNIEDFADHIAEKFGLIRGRVTITKGIHDLLIYLGERLRKQHNKAKTGDQIGEYVPPEPYRREITGQFPDRLT